MKRIFAMSKRMKTAILAALCVSASLLSAGCVEGVSDLRVELSASADSVATGEEVTYTIIISERSGISGQGGAINVTQTFTLPVEILAISTTNDDDPEMLGEGCAASNNGLTCQGLRVPSLSGMVTITVLVRTIQEGVLKSTAEAQFNDGFPIDAALGNNEATTTVYVTGGGGPNVAVVVLASPDPVAVGNDLTYEITLTNNSPGNVSGLTLVDTLPAGVTFISGLAGGCALEEATVTCGDIAIAGGDSVTYRFVVRPTTIGAITNSVSLQGRAPILTTVMVIPAGADLSVTMLASPDPVVVGDLLVYTITITNNGPVVEIPIPAEMSFTAPAVTIEFSISDNPNVECELNGQVLTCRFTLGPLDAVCPNCAVVKIGVRPTQLGPLDAEVQVRTTDPDPNPDDNTATLSTTVIPREADLAVTMTDNPDPVALGTNVTYTVNVTNNGPATATNILLTDFLPTNADLISITPSQGSCSAALPVETCSLGQLASGASASLTVIVSPREAGTLINTVSVVAFENDPLMVNNSATESTTVNEALVPNLSVTVADAPDPVVVNQPLTYTITVRNNGLGAANGFTIAATLPSSVTADNNNGFICSPDTSGNLVCQSSQAGLPSGGEASYSLVVTPTASGTIANTVNVTPAQTDADPADNTFTENTIVSAPAPTADVSVTISDSPDPVAVNQSLTYTITITNNGLATATGIVATVTLPSTINTSPPLSCTPAGGNTVCQLSAPFSLSNGAAIAYPLQVTPTAAGTVTVVASALATEDDPDKNNNTATETTTVSPPQMSADLEVVSVTDTPDPAVVNDQLIYTITVRNNGLSDATGVVLSNTLSERVVSDGGSSCPAGSGPVIQCPLGNMSSGSTQTIFLRARSSATGTVTNTVSVSAQETDPDTSNNTRAEETTIIPSNSADVSVSIAAQPNPVTLPANVTFTIVVQNTGPQAANAVMLTGFNVQMFQVPELLNITTTQGTCSLSSFPLLTCNLGTLANNSSATVTITGRPLPGTFTRAVTAGTSTTDPNLANNNASISVVVN